MGDLTPGRPLGAYMWHTLGSLWQAPAESCGVSSYSDCTGHTHCCQQGRLGMQKDLLTLEMSEHPRPDVDLLWSPAGLRPCERLLYEHSKAVTAFCSPPAPGWPHLAGAFPCGLALQGV